MAVRVWVELNGENLLGEREWTDDSRPKCRKNKEERKEVFKSAIWFADAPTLSRTDRTKAKEVR